MNKIKEFLLLSMVVLAILSLNVKVYAAELNFQKTNSVESIIVTGKIEKTITYEVTEDEYIYFKINPLYFDILGERSSSVFSLPFELYCNKLLVQKADVSSGTKPYHTIAQHYKKGDTIEVKFFINSYAERNYYINIEPVVEKGFTKEDLKAEKVYDLHLFSNNSDTYRYIVPHDGYISFTAQLNYYINSSGERLSNYVTLSNRIIIDGIESSKFDIDSYYGPKTSAKIYCKKGTIIEYNIYSTVNYFREYNFNLKINYERDYSALDKPEEPYCLLDSTNIIVGSATPNATVSIKYNNKTYKGKADQNGIYRISTAKLIAGKKVQISQKYDGRTSKKLTTKVVKNY
ncbi:MAG: hypothetical protein MJ131_04450 [Lachnospiraceae bacterium]|nr:hypothetical protein [Lachnospiraceae bacterium]